MPQVHAKPTRSLTRVDKRKKICCLAFEPCLAKQFGGSLQTLNCWSENELIVDYQWDRNIYKVPRVSGGQQ